jgi:formylmethanofuran dehydrogenase subunit E
MIRRCSVVLMVLASGFFVRPGDASDDAVVAERLLRVREVHGVAGPWAVAGYRTGERALKDLRLPRHSFALDVVHRSPAEVQYSCIADGVQAATGASPGKLNLHIEETTAEGLSTVVRDRKTGRALRFTLRPDFIRSIKDVPLERFEGGSRRVASLSDSEIFNVTTSN